MARRRLFSFSSAPLLGNDSSATSGLIDLDDYIDDFDEEEFLSEEKKEEKHSNSDSYGVEFKDQVREARSRPKAAPPGARSVANLGDVPIVTAQPVPFSQIGENDENIHQVYQSSEDRTRSETRMTDSNQKPSSTTQEEKPNNKNVLRIGLAVLLVIVVVVITSVCASGNCGGSGGDSIDASRQGQILSLISRMTLTNLNLRYPPPSSRALPEELALQWL